MDQTHFILCSIVAILTEEVLGSINKLLDLLLDGIVSACRAHGNVERKEVREMEMRKRSRIVDVDSSDQSAANRVAQSYCSISFPPHTTITQNFMPIQIPPNKFSQPAV